MYTSRERKGLPMFSGSKKIHIFRRFLLSYVLILVIPLIASFIVYQMSVQKMKENATEDSKKLLDQTVTIIDGKNEELEKLVYQISLNPAINQLMHRKSDDKNVGYDLYEVRENLIPYWYTNNIASHFYIYFNNIDTIISPESSYIRVRDYFDSHIYKDLTFAEWNKRMNQTYHTRQYYPSTKVKVGEKSESFITFVQSIPFSRTTTPEANIVVMIDEKEMTSLLNRISSQYDGATFVYDKDGNIIINDQMDLSLINFDKTKIHTPSIMITKTSCILNRNLLLMTGRM